MSEERTPAVREQASDILKWADYLTRFPVSSMTFSPSSLVNAPF